MTGYWLKVFSEGGVQTPVLSFMTTFHVALLVLRKYRSHPKGKATLLLVPSVVFSAAPWFLSSPFWLATVASVHVAWFVACEKLVAPALPAKSGAGVKPQAARPAPRASAPAAPPARKPAPATFTAQPVLAVLSETPEIRTFRFARPTGMTFRPGQFAMVKVELEGKPVVRCYSISSSPSASGYLEISVRKQGQVSGFLHATVRPGMTLQIKGPGGAFVYPEGSRPLVLLAAGIGITPLLSMLRHALDTEPTRPVTLLFSARTENQIPFHSDLKLLARRHPLFTLAIALSGGSERPEFYSGRIDRNLIEAVVENVPESVYAICGPLPMIEGTVSLLESLGVPKAQVMFEKFEAAVASATSAVSSTSPSPASAAGPVEPVETGEAFESAPFAEGCDTEATVQIKLRSCGRVVIVPEGHSILEAAESAGVEIPSMCRAGGCGTCRTRILEGEVEGDFDLIGEEERAEGWVLACVARPVGSCVVDA